MEKEFRNWQGNGSLTKEPPLATLERVLELAEPGMEYAQLRELAANDPGSHIDAPGLVIKRFLALDSRRIANDGTLDLVKKYGSSHPRVRRSLYLVWALRDERVRRFVLEVAADETGLWQPEAIRDKENARFFERFLGPDSAKKARSNFEYYLSEAGILRTYGRVELDPQGEWVPDAARIAANHAVRAELREQLRRAPLQFFHDRGLNGLINATLTEIAQEAASGTLARTAYKPRSGWSRGGEAKLAGREWKPRKVAEPGLSSEVEYVLDLVKMERANASHQRLEKVVAEAITTASQTPNYNQVIDLFCECSRGTALFEIKSCHEGNLHAQVRKGVSQLLEYRYVFSDRLANPIEPVLVLEQPLSGPAEWMVAYLVELGITPVWPDGSGSRLTTTVSVSPLLARLLA